MTNVSKKGRKEMKAKTFSRLLVLLLTMTMVLSLFPAAAFAADEAAEPCTITEGCTLAAGHEGECMLAEEAPVEPKESSEPSPEVTETPAPSEAPVPTEAPAATESPAPSETPAVTESPAPSETPAPTESPEADKAANEAVAKAQQAIDALAQTVDGKNAESVRAALAELDKLLESMSEEEKAQLSMDKYNAAKQALEEYDALPNVAAVNGVNYKSLQAAVDAVEGQTATISLLGDFEGGGVVVKAGSNIVFDLGGHTYTVGSHTVGSPGTDTNGFQLLAGSTVKFANGTVAGNENAANLAILIQNYSDLTLENVTLDISAAPKGQYALSTNNGSSQILGNSSIKASGKYALDVYYWASSYTGGVSLTIDTTGVLDGKLSYGTEKGGENDIVTKGKLNIKNATLTGAIETYGLNTAADNGISITGGKFASDVSAYVPDGMAAVKGEDGSYTIGSATTQTEAHVAKAGDTYYKSLQAAVDAAKDGETVTLLKDITGVTTAQTITFPAGKSIVFDMNGKSITVASDFSGRPIVNEGTLKVTGNGTIDSSASTTGGFGAINNKGTLTIENGTFKGNPAANGTCIRNTGSSAVLTVNGGSFIGSPGCIFNEGTATLNDGSFTGETCVQCFSPASWSYVVQNRQSASLTINGGTYRGVQGAIGVSGGEAVINNGSFTSIACKTHSNESTFYALYVAGGDTKAHCVVNGGSFATEGKIATVLVGNDTPGDGGAVLGASCEIKGGSFEAPKGVTVIKGAEKSGDPIVTGGSFSDNSAGKYVPDGYDAVEGSDGRFTVDLDTTASEEDQAEINGQFFNSLQAALDAAKQGETVKLLKDVSENVTIAEGKDIILELNGCTIDGGTAKGQAALTNNGKVTIQDSSAAQTGGIKRADNSKDGCYYTIKNEGDMTIAGGKVYNHAGGDSMTPWSGSSLVCNGQQKQATLNITGGVLSQDNFICVKNDDYGTLNVTGGTLKSNDQAVQNWNQASITGGSIQGAVGTWSYQDNQSSTTIGGSAVVEGNIYANNYDGSANGPVVNITGGTLNGELYVNTPSGSGSSDINVSGGSFKNPVEDKFCADGFVPLQKPDGSYGVATEGTDITITLKFDLTGGQGTVTTLSATAKAGQEASFTLPAEKPVKQFHKFLGWSTNKDYKPTVTRAVDANKLYQPGETFTTAADLQFYAIWEKLPTHVITLTYNANGGWRAPDPQSAEVVEGEYVDFVTTQQKPYRFGYVFQGWSFSPDGKLAVRPGQTVRASADTTLYAVWALPTDSPLTGDNSNLGLWIGLMGGSLVCVAIAAVIIIKKRKK